MGNENATLCILVERVKDLYAEIEGINAEASDCRLIGSTLRLIFDSNHEPLWMKCWSAIEERDGVDFESPMSGCL